MDINRPKNLRLSTQERPTPMLTTDSNSNLKPHSRTRALLYRVWLAYTGLPYKELGNNTKLFKHVYEDVRLVPAW